MEDSYEHKRSQHRVEAAIPIQVRGLDAAGMAYDESTTAVEVSRRGLSFLTRHELAPSATLTVVIPGRGPSRSDDEGPADFFAQATVTHSVKEDHERYFVGVRFVGATFPMYSPESI